MCNLMHGWNFKNIKASVASQNKTRERIFKTQKVDTYKKSFFLIEKTLAHSRCFRYYLQITNVNDISILHLDILFIIKFMLFFTCKMLEYILHRYNLSFCGWVSLWS